MQITGTITKVLPVQSGTSKEGKEWKKLSFLVKTNEEYNNLYCFDLFGAEKVENFEKFNKVNDVVEVDFNVKCNEWQGKYFTSLDAWKVFKSKSEQVNEAVNEVLSDEGNDLPF